jgi:hypothetical protein
MFPKLQSGVISGTSIVTMGYQGFRVIGETMMKNSLPISSQVNQKVGMARSRTMTGMKKRKRKGAKKSIKNQIMRLAEAKHLTFVAAGTTLVHNKLYGITLTQLIERGTTSQQRIGDQVYLDSLKLKGFFGSNTDAKFYIYRIIVGYTGTEVGNTTLAADLYDTTVFQTNTGSTYKVNGIMNPKNFTTLLDKTYEVNSQISGSRTVANFIENVSLKRNFPYRLEGAVYGKNTNLVVLVTGTGNDQSNNDSAGFISLSCDLIFKDF